MKWSFRVLRLPVLLVLAVIMHPSLDTQITKAAAATRAQSFELDNGMQVVVIGDHRAPVVTHMVWYKVGAADEAPGQSGIAHFLEHLMFKATESLSAGEFSKRVARMGGQDNAFTGQDVTAYFQRIARDRLPDVMKLEAERMTKLRLDEHEVQTERDVVLEERRSRVENSPTSILTEQMTAALYLSHPYGSPIIGWMHEIEQLSREQALAFYQTFYAPNNAVLVLAGDITVEDARDLAQATYGKIPRNGDVKPYVRPREPLQRAARRVELIDARAGQPMMQRYYLAPSYSEAEPGEAEALDLLMKIVGAGSTSRIYRELVSRRKIASSAGGWYSGGGRDSGRIAVYGVPSEGRSLAEMEAAIDDVLADVRDNGVSETELARAKRVYVADYIYESDSQSTLARRYGYGLLTGQSVEDIEQWPERIAKVTVADVAKVAKKHFDIRKSVTGYLKAEQSQRNHLGAASSSSGETAGQAAHR
ncbi:MAG: M16 family metallopeptidase [Hyphomicrobiaceae bacterium]